MKYYNSELVIKTVVHENAEEEHSLLEINCSLWTYKSVTSKLL